MSYVLRDYQGKNFHELKAESIRVRAVLFQAECGYGKGVFEAKILEGVARKKKHAIFLVHGRERVFDMHKRASDHGIPHGVLMGDERRERHHAVQVCSSDTVYRMNNKPKADLIIIDECHLAMSPTFRKVLDFYPEARIIGFTATPVLGNGRGLGVKSGGIFESLICGPPTSQLIAQGNLVGSRHFQPPAPPELKGLKKKQTGEFDDAQGASICDNRKVIGDAVEHYRRFSPDRKAVAFAFNQKHAFDVAEQFREQGINWACVTADTPEGDIRTPGTRQFYWHQYDHGDLVGISSCGVIDIGWDHSICKAILLMSKTSSFARYRQRKGRGSRTHKGYEHFHIHDHTGNLYEFLEQGPYFESDIQWQLDGDAVRPRDKDGPSPSVSTCKRPMPIPDDGVPRWFRGDTANGYMLCCYNTFKAGPKECPRCGLPIGAEAPEIEVEEGELQEVTVEMREKSARQLAYEAKMRARYLELVMAGRRGGKSGIPYKPGWASIQFKAEFHRFPNKAWKQEALEMSGVA